MTQTSSTPKPETRDALASLRINRDAPQQKSGRWWKILMFLGILAVAGWFGYQWAQSNGMLSEQTNWAPEMMQNRVEVRLSSVKVQQGRSADAVVVATGYLESRRQAGIGAQASGRIDQVFFEEGDQVKKGDLLAELDHKDLDASLAAAAASVARAKAQLAEQEVTISQTESEYKRSEKLWRSRSLSATEFDQAKFSYQAAVARRNSLKSEIVLAEAQMRQAEQLKENMFIRAPFDGTVISKDAEVGESILPGGMGGGSGRGSVATIANLEHLEIECDVQEDFISRVKEGQEADIAVDAVQNKKYHGVVRKIIPMGDRARATIKVKVTIADADKFLFPEMSGTVYFLPQEQELEVSDEPRVFCPTAAIASDEEGIQFVWVVDEEKRAQKIVVKTGSDKDGETEITEGLQGRERVVVNPEGLAVGTPVKVAD